MVEAFTRRLTSLVSVLELHSSQTPQLVAIHHHQPVLITPHTPLHLHQVTPICIANRHTMGAAEGGGGLHSTSHESGACVGAPQ